MSLSSSPLPVSKRLCYDCLLEVNVFTKMQYCLTIGSSLSFISGYFDKITKSFPYNILPPSV